MALDDLRCLLRETAEYNPRSLKLGFAYDRLGSSLSLQARAFLEIATGVSRGRIPFKQMYGPPWIADSMTIDWYNGLGIDEQAEVLALFTFEIHETTHHLDYLITPYGLNYHSKILREYLAVQRFLPLLLAEPPLPAVRLVDWEPEKESLHSDEFLSAWKSVRDIVITLEAFGDGGMTPLSKEITRGWGSITGPVHLLGRTYDPVTVRGFLPTITEPGQHGWYLRPATIMEARALVHSLTWIMRLFGNDERCRRPMSVYLTAFYGPGAIQADYSMLLTALASGFGHASLYEFVEGAEIESIRTALMMADGACWYALQAPPPGPGMTAVSNPVTRLLAALRFFAQAFSEQRSFPSISEALDALDDSPEAVNYELRPIKPTLEWCQLVVNHLQSLTQQIGCNAFRRHFSHVLEIQGRQMACRRKLGYTSYVGMPENGHPVLGFQSDEEQKDLAFQDYEPDPLVVEWFKFRDSWLYKMRRTVSPDELKLRLSTYFSSDPIGTKTTSG